MLKKDKLRYNEYYDMQHIYDELYAQSKNGNNFYKLLEIIGSEQNICLAYRNLKTNSGSKTAGTDGLTIDDIKHLCDEDIIMKVRRSLDNYQPKSVRRVFIPKSGSNKMRPLGIPCIWDRLVQQCILQVLEPICEPKFHNHSYGFRANRSAHHALGRVTSLINISKYHYCVDVDIKGFFDNVNHGKLLKQIWTLGIRDKRLICIISKMLKAEIDGEGVPEKGTPQGGLLSPLLSLIVLNELDWWVSSQWETFQPKHRNKNGWFQYAKKHTRLKSGFIVRYADDFKIMCSTYEEAQRFYHSTVDFLNKRLKLEISPEKSRVVNLKKNSSDFLGFKIKVIPKGKTKHGYVAKTDMNQKALKKAKTNLKLKVKDIVRHTTTFQIARYNLAVMGMQNYYCVATNIYNNLTEVSYALLPTTRVRFKKIAKLIPFETTSQDFQMKTTGIRPQTKIIMIADTPLLPINGVKHKNPLNFSQDICNFTEHGRSKIHEEIALVTKGEIQILLEYKDTTKSVEFNDNRISVFIAQQGNCYITNRRHSPTDMVCIYKNITETDRDKYQNLVFVEIPISKAILTESVQQAKMWLMNYGLNSQQKKKLNKIRANYGYQAIK
ncbi:TPA: group II intron reverse transcriptase/maturase [Clostridioides difficile]|uniref:Group II intron reverse transcriptase/maturase n=1 Tax=Amedibacterium intestinale TaxID=2583452 RepID=A0A6N4TE23_9FIRM|nr:MULTISPECIES: group II intron reverse transcriptase/maturase [Bacillota]SJW56956.1 group II intron reverse transcriptase/mutarase [Clostridioides difficile]BBK21178.1 group II intron reverse transcriptase/maturase [Amedibacterium intestinale]BBK21859.1 group II intron reverse transcriptase/maturase [Amedibacterium intestinale]BBK22482.1 group II intron reverse transcriptase/maturase [Amedibacterium intestinale]BBK23391.1 group II intron reverse transcriptase/maturase [Amedibacterium intesti